MNLFKKIISKFFSRKVLIAPDCRLIFVYHDVSNADSPQYSELYSTATETFRAQIEFLAANFELVSLEEIVSTEKVSEKRLACITFDDGFLSVRENALPYLESRGIPFAVFVNKAAIQEDALHYAAKFVELNKPYETKVYLDEDDLIFLNERGVLIGNHSVSHKILADCDADSLREEIGDSKQYLENLLGREITHFALPYGKREHYNPTVVEACFAAGHKFVYSTNPTWFAAADLNKNRRLIPRLGIMNQTPNELCFLINRPLLKKIDI